MRALIQRVSRASVDVDGRTVGSIDRGLLVLLGVRSDDTEKEVRFVAGKCANLRIFEDDQGKMNRSALDVGGQFLVVSQFTLYGDARRGRRPSFIEAAPPELSRKLYVSFVNRLRDMGLKVETGIFGATMDVDLVNQGPVTILIEKEANQ